MLIHGVRAPRGMATGWGLKQRPGPSLQPQHGHGLLFLKNSKPQMASSASPVPRQHGVGATSALLGGSAEDTASMHSPFTVVPLQGVGPTDPHRQGTIKTRGLPCCPPSSQTWLERGGPGDPGHHGEGGKRLQSLPHHILPGGPQATSQLRTRGFKRQKPKFSQLRKKEFYWEDLLITHVPQGQLEGRTQIPQGAVHPSLPHHGICLPDFSHVGRTGLPWCQPSPEGDFCPLFQPDKSRRGDLIGQA